MFLCYCCIVFVLCVYLFGDLDIMYRCIFVFIRCESSLCNIVICMAVLFCFVVQMLFSGRHKFSTHADHCCARANRTENE